MAVGGCYKISELTHVILGSFRIPFPSCISDRPSVHQQMPHHVFESTEVKLEQLNPSKRIGLQGTSIHTSCNTEGKVALTKVRNFTQGF